MTDRMDNTVSGLRQIVESPTWGDITNATGQFADTVKTVLTDINSTTTMATENISTIETKIESWREQSSDFEKQLHSAINENSEQFKKLTMESQDMHERMSELSKTVGDGFANVKSSADGYESVLNENAKLLKNYLAGMDAFGKQAKKQLDTQVTRLTDTVNVLGANAILVETSIKNQTDKLKEFVATVDASATGTAESVRGITNELSGLTNHFENEIKEFATDVVSELKTVSGVANTTLRDTKTAANAFSESVKSMATGVRETLIEMNTAHTQLTGQSQGLIKMTTKTTERLQPLSELIERYYGALPDLAKSSGELGAKLAQTVTDLDEKIATIRNTVEQSTVSLSESASKIDDLAGQSRQQMIDLMSDYAKAVDTMQTLNKQMMVARAAAPMEAISARPTETFARVSGRDFLTTNVHEFDKLYEQAVDMTRTMGQDIPDVVWQKYHDGDKTIFAKWLAKMLKATDKRQIRELLKSNNVFRSQAMQFIRGFDKILSGAKQTDTPDAVLATLAKTDLGMIHSAISPQL